MYGEIITQIAVSAKLILDRQVENHSNYLKKMKPIYYILYTHGNWDSKTNVEGSSGERPSLFLFCGPCDFSLKGIYSFIHFFPLHNLLCFCLL